MTFSLPTVATRGGILMTVAPVYVVHNQTSLPVVSESILPTHDSLKPRFRLVVLLCYIILYKSIARSVVQDLR
jgi:hypothetical protein